MENLELLEIIIRVIPIIYIAIVLIFCVPIIKIEVKLLEKIHKKTKTLPLASWTGVILGLITPYVGFVALGKYLYNFTKLRTSIYTETSKNPTIENVDKLIDFADSYTMLNQPKYWNQLRSVWFAVNESSNVPTNKKKELKQVLMLKGLTMHHNDAQIIDNYKG